MTRNNSDKQTEETISSQDNSPFQMKKHYIVGVGASAGGLEAIHELFDNIPAGTGFSFVVIQHLSPDYKSLLRDLISKHTSMEVIEAEHNMLIKPNCIYVIPIKKFLIVENGRLKLLEKNVKAEPNKAIDIFLNSLAKDKGEKSIAIILSGTGSDGSEGIEEIKKAGGLVLVQEPATAKFDGMPNSAIRSGFADSVTTPELMFQEMETYLKQPSLVKKLQNISKDDKILLYEILAIVKRQEGLDFTQYKKPTIIRRITRRMIFNRKNSFTEYIALLNKNPDEVSDLAKDFLIGVTRFFRDKEAFDLLSTQVIPEIVNQKLSSNDTLKIWSAGTFTGEEAYSLAIMVSEYLRKNKLNLEVKIFASDIDKEALDHASRGIYSADSVKELPKEIIDQYFIKENGKYQVTPQLRRMIIIAHHDIIKDPPFSKIDLISCRNLLIYLDQELQRKVISSLHFSLNSNGYLLLGPSENLGDHLKSFNEIDKRWKLYKNANMPRLPFTMEVLGSNNNTGHEPRYQAVSPQIKSSQSFINLLNEAASENYKFAGIFIDENYNILEALGKYKDFLHFPDNQLTMNFLKLIPKEMSIVLGSALLKSFKKNEKISLKSIRVKAGNQTQHLNVDIVPYLKHEKLTRRTLLVLISEFKKEETHDFTNDEGNTSLKVAAKRISELENELHETREHLQTAIEEVETANEELQSSNEELISSNEELQSTNEELQSLNEELHTVNAEHQLKIKELAQLNDDLRNYFNTTEIGQIFLNSALNIKKFTPSASRIINLIESDIGRPISHISNNILYDNLLEDVNHVLENQLKLEKEVQTKNKYWYQMSITPYVRSNKQVEGVVLTFVNITPLKQASSLISGVLNSSLSGILALKAVRNKKNKITDFEISLCNDTASKLTGIKKQDLLGKRLLKVLPGNKTDGLFDIYVKVVELGKPKYLTHYYNHDGIDKWFEISAVKIEEGVTVTFSDISEIKKSEQALIETNKNLQQKEAELLKLNNELEEKVEKRTKDLNYALERIESDRKNFYNVFMQAPALVCTLKGPDHVFDLVNPQYENLFENRQLKGKKIKEAIPELESQFIIQILDNVYKTGEPYIGKEIPLLLSKENTKLEEKYFNFIYQPFFSENKIEGILVLAYEVTEQVNARKELVLKNKQLIKINNELDNFIYVASHDLKSPITNIEGLVNELNDVLETDKLANEEIAGLMEMVSISVQKFKEIVNSLTDIIKIQKLEADDIENIDCHEIIENIKIGLRELINESNATIVTEIDEGCQTFRFSRRNINSILYNLLSNAIKYRSPGRPLKTVIRAKREGAFIVLEVSDNGLGIPKNKIDQLFNMFKRFHPHVEGAGVGLYIVKRIVDNAGGKIEVESEVGRGTTFKVFFPDASM